VVLASACDHREGAIGGPQSQRRAEMFRGEQPRASKPPLTCSNGVNQHVAASSRGALLAVLNTDVVEYLDQAGSIPVRLRQPVLPEETDVPHDLEPLYAKIMDDLPTEAPTRRGPSAAVPPMRGAAARQARRRVLGAPCRQREPAARTSVIHG